MSKWVQTETSRFSFQVVLWLIWSCIKLYVIGIYALLKELIYNRQTRSTQYSRVEDGMVAIVTGGASGIGYQVTRKLALRNVHVIIVTDEYLPVCPMTLCPVDVIKASRCEKEAVKAISKIRDECSTTKVEYLQLDLASFKSVELFVRNFLSWNLPLHIIVNNAGVMLVPYQETEDGLETHFQVNYLSHLYLTCLLIDKIKASGRPDRCSRVLNISSMVHWTADISDIQPRCDHLYSPHAAYAGSKLAIILGTYTLSNQLKGGNACVTVNCLHPGVVNSSLYNNVHWSIRWIIDIMRHTLFKTTVDAAENVVYLALSPEVEGNTGGYYDNKNFVQSKSCTYSNTFQSSVSRLCCEQLNSEIILQVS